MTSALDRLATKHVGDGRSKLIFVTTDRGVVAVFDGVDLLPDAIRIAKTFVDPAWVETKDGVEYDNPSSAARQREEEEDD